MPEHNFETACSYCGDIFTSDESQSDADQLWIDHLSLECRNCGDSLCPGGYETNECYECGRVFCDDCRLYHDRGECDSCGDICCECDDEEHDGGSYGGGRGRLLAYNFRPASWSPEGNYPHEALLGFELELDGDQGVIADIASDYLSPSGSPRLFAKEDGSIQYGGEIVSQPMTLAVHATYAPDMIRALSDAGCDYGTGHGLHVHVSRNTFRRNGKPSQIHRYLWLAFIYANRGIMQQLGRRNSARWARFECPHTTYRRHTSRWWQESLSCGDCFDLRGKARRPYSHDRYTAVNCCNERTYECRWPMAALDVPTFLGTLQVIDAMVEYTRGLRVADLDYKMTFVAFRAWLDDRPEYELASHLVDATTTVRAV